MKVLIEVRHEDTLGNKFVNCQDCAVARAVKRVVRVGVFISEGVYQIHIGSHTIPHTTFSRVQFDVLNKNPATMHVLEMDIPKEYLRQEYLTTIPARNMKEVSSLMSKTEAL